jgi:NADH dehydrogenase FAD-containing subunit
VTAADLKGKVVEVTLANSEVHSLPYDQLVIATGARAAAPNMPWKALDTHDETIDTLHYTAARVKDAQHIVVAGAGSTGVEVAGELGCEYGKTKKIVLLCAEDKLLGGDSVAAAAANELGKLNVTIKYGARVKDTQTTAEGRTHVILTTGEIIATDLYLPTTGLIPNTEYLPAQYLSADPDYRSVLVDEQLRVQGARDAFACGDAVSKPRAGFLITQKQASDVAKSVMAALYGGPPNIHKGLAVDIYACSIGRDRGAGRMGSIRLPSFAVWLAKGRTLGMQYLQKYIDGSIA